ncbi:LysR family transcriptional regulator [Nonomuraea typhae]|uniref:LysR family transcriptional regulator n=1 Tax=Nonomuraea typhae TaxID=2603600 RepID=UPI0012FC8FAD|nr:LysR family transcriptional regulator [Nonomuraea typhae]
MDPRLLRTLVSVARWESFSGAAQELGYTQSAVSQQIAALEADLGLPLLRRRPVRLTEAGARLLEHAGPLLLRIEAARADVRRAAAAPAHRLTVAASPLAVTPVVAGRLARARAAQPRLHVELTTAGRDGAATEVAAGRAELGLADGITAPSDPLRLPDTGPMTALGIAEEDLVVALPPDHPLAGRAGLRLADLVDAAWLQTSLCPLERLRQLLGDGFRYGLAYTGDDVHTVLNLVRAGHGLTLLPASVGEGVPLLGPRLVHRVELLHGALPDGPAAQVRDVLAASGEAG